jgi:gluconate 2-dehydrogenase gamma chain
VDRRQFLEAIAGISSMVPALALLSGVEPGAFAAALHARAEAAGNLRTLSAAQDATLSAIAELLLPQTDTVGASAVGVNRFIDLLLTESMLEADRDRFLAGLAAIEARCQSLYGASFVSARRADQESLIGALDARLPARAATPAERAAIERQPVTAERGYATLKQLVVFAYFTSEPVAKGLINAPIIPGRYDGCVPA